MHGLGRQKWATLAPMKRLSIPLLLLTLAAMVPAYAANPPAAVVSLLTQAQDAQVRGETELALRMAQAAIVADPAQTVSYVALGDIYAQQGQAEYARSYYELALQIDPQDAAALKAMAAIAATTKAAANTP
jgi:tetratricopeptide (TPR) repeat protein